MIRQIMFLKKKTDDTPKKLPSTVHFKYPVEILIGSGSVFMVFMSPDAVGRAGPARSVPSVQTWCRAVRAADADTHLNFILFAYGY